MRRNSAGAAAGAGCMTCTLTVLHVRICTQNGEFDGLTRGWCLTRGESSS
jgi:hypothetical protein